MCVFFPNGVDLDVFGVVDVDERLVDIRAVGPWVDERRVQITALISDLSSILRFEHDRYAKGDRSRHWMDDFTFLNRRLPPPPLK